MKIAFTHDQKTSPTEEQAEYDSPATVAALATALRRLGHDVHLVEASDRAARLVVRLEFLRPDLVFNTARGNHNRSRDAFFPALFAELDLPFTGAETHVCALTRDKHAAKGIAAAAGIPTPRWVFFGPRTPYAPPDLRYPLIAKPNFEGGSRGIDPANVARDPQALEAAVTRLRARYPHGVLVEEFITGRDITVPYLEGAGDDGALEPAGYTFSADAPDADAGSPDANPHDTIRHSAARHADPPTCAPQVPADLDPAVRAHARALACAVIEALGIRHFGRVDFRLAQDGQLHFIEAHTRPDLSPDGVFMTAACATGLDGPEAVLKAIIAAARPPLPLGTTPPRPALRVGLTHNLKRIDPSTGDDSDAEYDAPSTINAIADALRSLGHEVVLLEATAELPELLTAADVDVVFNVAEGLRGRNREAQIPALLELLGIEYTGSDPATLAITLDKALAKRLIREAGIHTADFALLEPGNPRPPRMTYPLIVKPNTEGSSKGVTRTSVVRSDEDLARALEAVCGRYHQKALVEAFLPGREFTIGLLGDTTPRVLPPMEIVFGAKAGPEPVYAFHHKQAFGDEVRYEVPARLDPELERALTDCARECFDALGCRDVARIDLRLDAEGRVNFIECNPLPGLTPGWSDLCMIAEADGLDYRGLIGEILAPALRRSLTREPRP